MDSNFQNSEVRSTKGRKESGIQRVKNGAKGSKNSGTQSRKDKNTKDEDSGNHSRGTAVVENGAKCSKNSGTQSRKDKNTKDEDCGYRGIDTAGTAAPKTKIAATTAAGRQCSELGGKKYQRPQIKRHPKRREWRQKQQE
ncbi:uncharacterized protein N7496_012241 [Penicillium cataractarum]|uniref:Uncharacterized protein n=1 Tax=Penicillium cataractarum TaxID=2100454 RepID=A0A9W9USL5_9EURO|nr:uncharacterized protein N7496_012241 [Penicillium cataractarum]KAJ5355029.1 hypothetical protein N7496_012241 [Penicillium cataractarum]